MKRTSTHYYNSLQSWTKSYELPDWIIPIFYREGYLTIEAVGRQWNNNPTSIFKKISTKEFLNDENLADKFIAACDGAKEYYLSKEFASELTALTLLTATDPDALILTSDFEIPHKDDSLYVIGKDGKGMERSLSRSDKIGKFRWYEKLTTIRSWAEEYDLPLWIVNLLERSGFLSVEEIGKVWEEDYNKLFVLIKSCVKKIEEPLVVSLIDAFNQAKRYLFHRKATAELMKAVNDVVKESEDEFIDVRKEFDADFLLWMDENSIPISVRDELTKLNISTRNEFIALSEETLVTLTVDASLKPLPKKKFLFVAKQLKSSLASHVASSSSSLEFFDVPMKSLQVMKPMGLDSTKKDEKSADPRTVYRELKSSSKDYVSANTDKAEAVKLRAVSLPMWECSLCRRQNEEPVVKCLDCFTERNDRLSVPNRVSKR